MYFCFFNENYDHFFSSCCCYMAALYFETHFLEFKMVLDQWFELVHDEDVLIHVLACFHVWQLFSCFYVFGPLSFWIFWTLCRIFEAIFALSCQSKGQFFSTDNHVPNSPMQPKIYVVNLGILPVYTFIIDNIAVQKLIYKLC